MGRYGTPNLANMFRNVVASVPRGTIAERLREALQTDVTSIAHTLDYPMASLQAERDRLVPTRAALPCPPGMMVRIQGPHFLLQTRARECAVEVAKLAADWGRADAAEQI